MHALTITSPGARTIATFLAGRYHHPPATPRPREPHAVSLVRESYKTTLHDFARTVGIPHSAIGYGDIHRPMKRANTRNSDCRKPPSRAFQPPPGPRSPATLETQPPMCWLDFARNGNEFEERAGRLPRGWFKGHQPPTFPSFISVSIDPRFSRRRLSRSRRYSPLHLFDTTTSGSVERGGRDSHIGIVETPGLVPRERLFHSHWPSRRWSSRGGWFRGETRLEAYPLHGDGGGNEE